MRQFTSVTTVSVFSESDRTDFEKVSNPIKFPAGSLIMDDGEASSFVLYLVSGHVKVVKHARIVAVCGPGDVIGDTAFMTGGHRVASVYALTDVATRHAFATTWLTFLHDHPQAALGMLAATHQRLAATTEKLADAGLDAETKFATTLVELIDAGVGDSDGEAIVVRLHQRDLADMAGISRESVVHAVRQLKTAGIVTTGRQLIRVHDVAKLNDIISTRNKRPRLLTATRYCGILDLTAPFNQGVGNDHHRQGTARTPRNRRQDRGTHGHRPTLPRR